MYQIRRYEQPLREPKDSYIECLTTKNEFSDEVEDIEQFTSLELAVDRWHSIYTKFPESQVWIESHRGCRYDPFTSKRIDMKLIAKPDYKCSFCARPLEMVNERDLGYMCANEDCNAMIGIISPGERKAQNNFCPIDNKKAFEIAESAGTLYMSEWHGKKVKALNKCS